MLQQWGCSNWHTGTSVGKEAPCIQLDWQFMSAAGECITARGEATARITILTLVDCETGYVGALMVNHKKADPYVVKLAAAFVDRVRAELVRLRYDNEPSIVQLAENILAWRRRGGTKLEPI